MRLNNLEPRGADHRLQRRPRQPRNKRRAVENCITLIIGPMKNGPSASVAVLEMNTPPGFSAAWASYK